ncbi:unnamed protein product [Vitrella brassicaformis CCMP3155]|uniref:Uncharacterized protein n=2 Tax=Vitrella brassicaformis TaxID=1169539 RepID=A0A0G4GPE3_VITBC|nr:unnamed protein product [Vitrella brassicaformis CCMP3155]|eukprot:CEM32225.1 unnamed protein product [Vitrella brassicaformis CCMP3155]
MSAHHGRRSRGTTFVRIVTGRRKHPVNAHHTQVAFLSASSRLSPHSLITRWPSIQNHTALLSSATQSEIDDDPDRQAYDRIVTRLREQGEEELLASLTFELWKTFKGAERGEQPVPTERVELTKNDLMDLADVPLPEEIIDQTKEPPKFIGDTYLNNALMLLEAEYQQETDYAAYRVAPMTFTRFSRGGKTTMLYEMGNRLKAKRMNPLFVSFNEGSLYSTGAKGEQAFAPTLLDSVYLRAAWAAAKTETREAVAERAGVAVDRLRFSDWLKHVSVTRETIDNWLGDQPCVMLIDELNKVVKRERYLHMENDLGEYLKTDFLLKGQRYFVFSSHVTTIKNDLRKFLNCDSNRPVLQPRLPVIGVEDLKHVRDFYGASPAVTCWAGRSPALLWVSRNYKIANG